MRKLLGFSFMFMGLFIGMNLSAQEKKVEFEPRIGFNLLTAYDNGVNGGYTLGGMVSVPITERFAIQPGFSFLGTRADGEDASALLIPVYASYRIPLETVRLRLNAGIYGQLGDDYNGGVSVEVGVEYKRWFAGVQAYQSLLGDDLYGIFGLSVGYKFTIH